MATHKKIILFADGTGNSPSSPHRTNVWRLYQALDLSDKSQQIAFYTSGVGTHSFSLLRLIGLVFGWGLAANVKEIYAFLCRTYEPGDEIHCFGFSRGAFTIRVLVALIDKQGIINTRMHAAHDHVVRDEAELQYWVKQAYRAFRRQCFKPSILSLFGAPIRDFFTRLISKITGRRVYDPTQNFQPGNHEKIGNHLVDFVGVWDTVDAYGSPIDEMTSAWDFLVWPLSADDYDLSDKVKHARHALSIDDQRLTFEPMLWNEAASPTRLSWAKQDEDRASYDKISQSAVKESHEKGSLLQVWFSGVHSNLGGGYPDDSLSIVSLDWMIKECEIFGNLAFRPSALDDIAGSKDIYGPIYDSRASLASFYRYHPRNIDSLNQDRDMRLRRSMPVFVGNVVKWFKNRESFKETKQELNPLIVDNPNAIIHETVFKRIAHGGDKYAPFTLPKSYKIMRENGQIVGMDKVASQAEYFETSQQSHLRSLSQNLIWKDVAKRKMAYWASLLLIGVFALYPYIRDYFGDYVPLSDYENELAPAVGTIGAFFTYGPQILGMIPGLGFVSDWLTRFADYPFHFFGLFAAVIITINLRGHYGGKIAVTMRQNWFHLTQSGRATEFYSLGAMNSNEQRQKPAVKGLFFKRLLEVIFIAFFVVMLAVILMMSARSYQALDEWFGLSCAENKTVQYELDQPFFFDPKKKCDPTGIKVQKGQTYLVEMTVTQKAYAPDGTLTLDWPEKYPKREDAAKVANGFYEAQFRSKNEVPRCLNSGHKDAAKNDPYQWCDVSIESHVNGWHFIHPKAQGTLSFYWNRRFHLFLVPTRFHLFLPWYQPMIRLGHEEYNRYPLVDDHTLYADVEFKSETMTAAEPRSSYARYKFTPDSDNEIYLYLNDARFFGSDFFYNNNGGKACMRISSFTEQQKRAVNFNEMNISATDQSIKPLLEFSDCLDKGNFSGKTD